MTNEQRLSDLGEPLPPAPKPAGLYKPVVVVGNMAYVSGHGPLDDMGELLKGRAGEDLTAEQAQVHAWQCGLTIVSTLKAHFGSLDRIVRVVKLLGLVNSTPDFHDHPHVINGCSAALAEVFGQDNGVGARSAFGVAALPGNISVEVEGIFEIKVSAPGKKKTASR